MADSPNWSAVVSYCEMGFKVFPLAYGKKTPLFETNWVTIATNDVVKARALFPLDNHWNIGISFGPDSNVCDIEIDNEVSFKAMHSAFDIFGEPKTVAYKSNRGTHRLFRWNARLSQFGKAVLYWSGVECRLGTTDVAAYSVAPPSLHPSGQFYDWLPGQAPWEVPILDMPQWLEELYFNAQDKFESKSMVGVSRSGDDLVPEAGQRHEYLIRFGNLLAGQLRLPHDISNEMLLVLAEYLGKVADNGLEATQKECRDIVRTALRSNLPQEDFPTVDFGAMYEQAKVLSSSLKEEQQYVPRSPGIPVHIFSPFLESFAHEARNAGYSKELVLMSILGSCSVAIGNSVQVRYAPHADPLGLQIYSLGVAGASGGKSMAINRITSPMCVGVNYCTDANSASMTSALFKSPRGVLLKVTEGKELNKMLGRYLQTDSSSPDPGSDSTVFLQAWSGEMMKVLRKSGDISIEHPFLSIVAAMQPYGLHGFTIHDIMDGLMQRFFIYDSQKLLDDFNLDSLALMSDSFKDYVKILDRLKSIRPFVFNAPSIDMEGGQHTSQCTQPVSFILDREAYTCWNEYARSKRSSKVQDEFPEGHPFQADLMRHAEMVLRVAAIFHAIDLASCDRLWEESRIHVLPQIWIPRAVVQRAIDFVEYMWERKQLLMTDIADDRYSKVNPLGSTRITEDLPAYLDKFVVQRQRKLEKNRKSTDHWTLREYQRYLGLLLPAAEAELETMIRMGRVAHAGVQNKSNVYCFIDKKSEKGG